MNQYTLRKTLKPGALIELTTDVEHPNSNPRNKRRLNKGTILEVGDVFYDEPVLILAKGAYDFPLELHEFNIITPDKKEK